MTHTTWDTIVDGAYNPVVKDGKGTRGITPPKSQIIDCEQRPIGGLYACGELIGGLFDNNDPGGAGLTAGAVFGTLGGANAATAS